MNHVNNVHVGIGTTCGCLCDSPFGLILLGLLGLLLLGSPGVISGGTYQHRNQENLER